MNKSKRIMAIPLVTALLLAAAGCKLSSGLLHGLVLGLQVTVDAASVAISVISAADPAGVPALKYAQDISQAASQTITELGTSDSSLDKINKSIGYFEAVAVPHFQPGTQRIIVASVGAIEKAVELFLEQLQASRPAMAAVVAGGMNPQVSLGSLSHADRQLVKSMQKKARANIEAAIAKQ